MVGVGPRLRQRLAQLRERGLHGHALRHAEHADHQAEVAEHGPALDRQTELLRLLLHLLRVLQARRCDGYFARLDRDVFFQRLRVACGTAGGCGSGLPISVPPEPGGIPSGCEAGVVCVRSRNRLRAPAPAAARIGNGCSA